MDDQNSKVLSVMKEDFYHAKVEELQNRVKSFGV